MRKRKRHMMRRFVAYPWWVEVMGVTPATHYQFDWPKGPMRKKGIRMV